MTRSITAKLVLAFLVLSITIVALASGITYWRTVAEFKKLVFNQVQSRYVADAALYYQINGSWDGAREYFDLRDSLPGQFMMGFQQDPQDPQGYAGGGFVTRTTTSQTSFAFLLADAEGKVLVPAGQYEAGDVVPTAKLNQGTPVSVNGLRVGTVLVFGSAPPLGPFELQYLDRTNQALFYTALGAALVALVLGIILASTLTHPLRDLTSAIQAISKGDFKQHVSVKSLDEIGQLARAFNRMSADLQRLTNSRRQMTADIAHDLRTPLTVIGGYVESMQEGVLKPTPERLETIHTEVVYLQRLVEDLRTLSEADAGVLSLNCEMVTPQTMLTRISKTYHHLADRKKIVLETLIEPDLPAAHIDPDRMAQVFGNLLTNSLRFTPEGGRVTLSARREGDCVAFLVEDNGSGISPDALPHIFDRFYRADPARKADEGSGLGLAIARSITEAHGGTISAQSRPSAGTTIKILLHIKDI